MQAFRRALIDALSAAPKKISPKWLYDARGSELFEDITRLPEYYPTRQERALLKEVAPKWAQAFGQESVLVELGSGASEKTRIVLDAIPGIATYVALDISESALEQAVKSLNEDYPELDIRPLLGDFSRLPELPSGLPNGRRVGFFPGSTIGNLDQGEAIALLTSARNMLGQGALFILGVDLIKDRATLEAAYDDASGVTADFDLNLLKRANAEVGADFDLSAFRHRAIWNASASRIEMHLEAIKRTTVRIGGQSYSFAEGETLHTESSRKFDRAQIEQLARASGWKIRDWAQSDAPSVALVLLELA